MTLCAALGCGLIAGVFFAFSAFVMKALARRPAGEGFAAMQPINVVVINPVFVAAFVGTGAACVLLVIAAPLRWHAPGAAFLLAAVDELLENDRVDFLPLAGLRDFADDAEPRRRPRVDGSRA